MNNNLIIYHYCCNKITTNNNNNKSNVKKYKKNKLSTMWAIDQRAVARRDETDKSDEKNERNY